MGYNIDNIIVNLKKQIQESGGGSGTSDYSQLTNKPQINEVTLSGNKSLSDLGIAGASDLAAVEALIPESASTSNQLATASDIPDVVVGNPSGSATAGNLTKLQIGSDIYSVPSGGTGSVYSDTETEIGSFLGVPLYRKCFTIASMPNATTSHIASGLTGITVRRLYGGCNNPGTFLNIPHLGSSFTYAIVASYDYINGNIDITTQTDDSAYSGWMCLEYTKNS